MFTLLSQNIWSSLNQMPFAVLEVCIAFMFHLGPALWNQVTLRSHRVSCKQCAQTLVAWYRTEAQFKETPEEFLLLWGRLTGHVTFWKENKKMLPSEDSGNIFLWKAFFRCCLVSIGQLLQTLPKAQPGWVTDFTGCCCCSQCSLGGRSW